MSWLARTRRTEERTVRPKLGAVVPCYNEAETLARSDTGPLEVFAGRSQVAFPVTLADDCSTDGSEQTAERLAALYPGVLTLRHPRNRGKGAALPSGFETTTGDLVAILEDDPRDLEKLLEPLLAGAADAVYGSRFLSGSAHRILYFGHSAANRMLTLLSVRCTELNLTDMETCYEVFRGEGLDRIRIEEERFGFEPAITAKVAAQRVRIYERRSSTFVAHRPSFGSSRFQQTDDPRQRRPDIDLAGKALTTTADAGLKRTLACFDRLLSDSPV